MELFIFLLAAVFLVIGFLWGYHAASSEMETQAVKRGYATWKVNDDGSTEFKWKDETE